MINNRRPLTVQFTTGPSSEVFQFTMNLNDPEDVKQKLVEIVECAKGPLIAQVNLLSRENEALKQRCLSNDEI